VYLSGRLLYITLVIVLTITAPAALAITRLVTLRDDPRSMIPDCTILVSSPPAFPQVTDIHIHGLRSQQNGKPIKIQKILNTRCKHLEFVGLQMYTVIHTFPSFSSIGLGFRVQGLLTYFVIQVKSYNRDGGKELGLIVGKRIASVKQAIINLNSLQMCSCSSKCISEMAVSRLCKASDGCP
jgi:hypothetical protein